MNNTNNLSTTFEMLDHNRGMKALNVILVAAAWVLVAAAIMYYPEGAPVVTGGAP